MTFKVKMRLMLLCGVVMLVLTYVVVVYGFKKTEELRSEKHVQELMLQPKASAFGDVPTGLSLAPGGSPSAAEKIAQFDDGLTATLLDIQKRSCTSCESGSELVALLQLEHGNIPKDRPADVRLSNSRLQWSDLGYVVTLLEIQPDSIVFTVDARPVSK